MLSILNDGEFRRTACVTNDAFPHFDLDAVRELVRVDDAKLRVHFVPVIGSTMNVAVWARENSQTCSPGLVLVAGEQPEGIGYKGQWLSVPHKDVMMTIVVDDVQTLRAARLVQFASALSVCQGLEQVMRSRGIGFSPFDNRPFVIKYPNDVYANTQSGYKKICGSMCIGSADAFWKSQTSVRAGLEFPTDVALLGIGVNLATTAAPEGYNGPPRVSFEQLTGALVVRETVIARILTTLSQHLAELKSDEEKFVQRIIPYFGVTTGARVMVEYKTDSGRANEEAIFRDVTAHGIRLERSDCVELVPHAALDRVVNAGEVV